MKTEDKSYEELYIEFYEAVVDGSFNLLRPYGICYNFYTYHDKSKDDSNYPKSVYFIMNIYKNWPEFSGNMDYPIKSMNKTPEEEYQFTGDLWDKETAYGEARWELFEYIYEVCKDRIATNQLWKESK